jgi:nitrite reductase/ring-hydroxylating ferredoxin subunit
MSEWCDAADESSLTTGSCRTVEVRGRKLALVRTSEGFFAVEDACPHRGSALGAGFLDGSTLHCPLHGWGFDVRSGAGLTRPDKPVRTYPVRIAEGRVWIALD